MGVLTLIDKDGLKHLINCFKIVFMEERNIPNYKSNPEGFTLESYKYVLIIHYNNLQDCIEFATEEERNDAYDIVEKEVMV